MRGNKPSQFKSSEVILVFRTSSFPVFPFSGTLSPTTEHILCSALPFTSDSIFTLKRVDPKKAHVHHETAAKSKTRNALASFGTPIAEYMAKRETLNERPKSRITLHVLNGYR